MPHWKLTLSYDGTHFHGWQVQPGLMTVQGRLAAAIHQMTGETVLPQGSGRTDAGVHALGQVTSFSLQAALPAGNLQRALNRILPPSIRIDRAELVDASFHARHSARRKLYEYRIFEQRPAPGIGRDGEAAPERICSPFLFPFIWACRWPLHFESLGAAAERLVGTHDFSAMAAGREPRSTREIDEEGWPESELEGVQGRPNPVKTIFESSWSRVDGLLVYRICGSGFLHHMVRNIVGTMVDIGRGSRKLEDLAKILSSRDRSQAGATAPASGLYLVEVDYSDTPRRASETKQQPAARGSSL